MRKKKETPGAWALPNEFYLVVPSTVALVGGAGIGVGGPSAYNTGVHWAPRPYLIFEKPGKYPYLEGPPVRIAGKGEGVIPGLQELFDLLGVYSVAEFPKDGDEVPQTAYGTVLLAYTGYATGRYGRERQQQLRVLASLCDSPERIRAIAAFITGRPAGTFMGGYAGKGRFRNSTGDAVPEATPYGPYRHFWVEASWAKVTGYRTGRELACSNRGEGRPDGLITCRPRSYGPYVTAVREFVSRLFSYGGWVSPTEHGEGTIVRMPLEVGAEVLNTVNTKTFENVSYLQAALRGVGFTMGTQEGGWYTVRQIAKGAGSVTFQPKEWEVLNRTTGEVRTLPNVMRTEPSWKAHFRRPLIRRIRT